MPFCIIIGDCSYERLSDTLPENLDFIDKLGALIKTFRLDLLVTAYYMITDKL